jgi:hypothetical protein
MLINKLNVPIRKVNRIDLVATLLIFVVAPALLIWWLKGQLPGIVWWPLALLYVFWLRHLFNFDKTADVDETPCSPVEVITAPVSITPESTMPAPATKDTRPWQQRVEEIERSRPASMHWASVLIQGHEGVQSCINRGDWDSARAALQRLAYSKVDVPAEEKAAFTEYMKDFASIDPLYRTVMDKALPLIIASPGMKQTQFYPQFPAIPAETIRYVFYYADQLGEIVRQKKGNTYLIHPAQEQIQR